MIKDKMDYIEGSVREALDKVDKERYNKLLDKSKEMVNKGKEKLKPMIDALKEFIDDDYKRQEDILTSGKPKAEIRYDLIASIVTNGSSIVLVTILVMLTLFFIYLAITSLLWIVMKFSPIFIVVFTGLVGYRYYIYKKVTNKDK